MALPAQGIFYSSAAVGSDGTVYARSEDGRLHAINPDNGIARWVFRLGVGTVATYSAPSIAPDGTIYCVGNDSKLYAVTRDGAQKWVYSTDFIYTSPAVGSDGTVYLATVAPTRRVFALRPDGTVRWEFIAGDTVSSSPVIGLDGTLFFGCADKKLYALTSNGELRWTFETGDAIRNSTPAVASDGSVFVGCLDGKLYCIEPDGTLRRTYSTAHEVRTSPVLHNGRVYFGCYDYRLYAVDVGQVPASTPWPMHRQNSQRLARVQNPALAIGVQPQPKSAEVGDTVVFSVGAVGTPPLAYQWSFNGQPIAGATRQSYRVDPVTHGSRGQFSVRVSDATGSLTSNPATLTVTTPLLPPSVFAAPAATVATAGESVTLRVAALGTEPFTYQWLRDGEPITGATGSSYTLATPRPSDSGSYSVRITNIVSTVTSGAAVLTVNPVTRISNLSIRSRVGGSSGMLTVGLTIGGTTDGTADKPVLLRAVGPTLAAFGVDGTLADPRLAILRGSTVIAQNDDWAGSAQVAATSVAVGAFALGSDASKDAAVVHAAPAGGYTVQITGAGSSSGVALTEVYDTTASENFSTTTPRLTNVSALTQVGTGGDILIAGFSISGVAPKTVLIRGIGPTLGTFGVGGTLNDPKLEIYQNGIATVHAANDNWSSATNAADVATAAGNVGAFALPSGSRDAALLVTLPPGSYTAQISGVNGATGTALVEIYEVP